METWLLIYPGIYTQFSDFLKNCNQSPFSLFGYTTRLFVELYALQVCLSDGGFMYLFERTLVLLILNI
jgi:hypothetical protein